MSETSDTPSSDSWETPKGRTENERADATPVEALPVLSLRALASGGRFFRTVNCFPGKVTVIQEQKQGGFEPFRMALLGKPSPMRVDMRYRSAPLRQSEIHVPGVEDVVGKKQSVTESLKFFGVPETMEQSVLQDFELLEYAEKPVDELPNRLARNLSVCCALFSKTKFLVLDDLTASFTGKSWEKVQKYIVDSVRNTDRVAIVTGLEKVPSQWEGNDSVAVEALEGVRKRKMSFTAAPTDETLIKVRDMMNLPRITTESLKTFTTYPQKIGKVDVRTRAPRTPESLYSEAIANPNVERVISMDSSADSLEGENPTPSALPAKVQKTSLTKVSTAMRLSYRLDLASMVKGAIEYFRSLTMKSSRNRRRK